MCIVRIRLPETYLVSVTNRNQLRAKFSTTINIWVGILRSRQNNLKRSDRINNPTNPQPGKPTKKTLFQHRITSLDVMSKDHSMRLVSLE
jgi:hypothetical protein